MVPIVTAGMAVWAIIGLVLLANRSALVASGREEWITICLYGVLVAVPGLLLMLRHDANRRRRTRDGSGLGG